MNKENIIEIKNVSIEYPLKRYVVKSVTNCSLNIKRNKITALVGESGSGKTTLASAIIDCISEPGIVTQGEIYYYGKNEYKISELSESQKQAIRWKDISMVFQAAQSSLNPIMTIWQHFYETYYYHDKKATKEQVKEKAIKLLRFVKLDPERVLDSYPHELSGGMKQRVMIAFALLLDPEMIILDEPTTALDVITQNYIFEILREINTTMNISMLLMTHDINVVAKFSDYVAVMYAGRIVEYGKTKEVFSKPQHPYTKGLLAATPSLSNKAEKLHSIPGNPPDMRETIIGCPFSPRCKLCSEKCKGDIDIHYINDEWFVKCTRFKGSK